MVSNMVVPLSHQSLGLLWIKGFPKQRNRKSTGFGWMTSPILRNANAQELTKLSLWLHLRNSTGIACIKILIFLSLVIQSIYRNCTGSDVCCFCHQEHKSVLSVLVREPNASVLFSRQEYFLELTPNA